jgi:hypothetical protein
MSRWDYMNLAEAILEWELDLVCSGSMAGRQDNLVVKIRA